MSTQDDHQRIRRLSGHSDIRTLPKAEQAIRIQKELGCHVKDVLEVLHVSKGQYYRAKHAMQEGRPVGVAGRPTYLTEAQEMELVERVRTANKNNETYTVWDLCDEVQ